jgi:UDP-glucose 4-epimerase
MKKRRVIITGGCGFLGRYIAEEALRRNFDVVIIDKHNTIKNNKIKFYKEDISRSNKIYKLIKKNDIVYHFAGISDINEANKDPEKTFEINTLSTIKLLKICKRKKIKKIIFASSIYVHSDIGGIYRITKKSSELFIETYAKQHNFKYTIVRFGSVYGPKQSNKNNITNIVHNALMLKKLIYSGSKNSIRRFVYVTDVAKASVNLVSKKYDNKVILITGKKINSINQVFNIVKKILKINSSPIYKNIKNNHYSKNPYSYKEMKEEKYIFNKFINLEKGIKEVINYEKKK